jgi:hypothetical protein
MASLLDEYVTRAAAGKHALHQGNIMRAGTATQIAQREGKPVLAIWRYTRNRIAENPSQFNVSILLRDVSRPSLTSQSTKRGVRSPKPHSRPLSVRP